MDNTYRFILKITDIDTIKQLITKKGLWSLEEITGYGHNCCNWSDNNPECKPQALYNILMHLYENNTSFDEITQLFGLKIILGNKNTDDDIITSLCESYESDGTDILDDDVDINDPYFHPPRKTLDLTTIPHLFKQHNNIEYIIHHMYDDNYIGLSSITKKIFYAYYPNADIQLLDNNIIKFDSHFCGFYCLLLKINNIISNDFVFKIFNKYDH